MFSLCCDFIDYMSLLRTIKFADYGRLLYVHLLRQILLNGAHFASFCVINNAKPVSGATTASIPSQAQPVSVS